MTDPATPTPPTPPMSPEAPDLGDRMKTLGEELGARGQQFGREAQAAGERWSKDPAVAHVADTTQRFWGLILLAAGIWFAAQVTFGYTLPTIPWSELWPLALIALGLFVILRGMTRRS